MKIAASTIENAQQRSTFLLTFEFSRSRPTIAASNKQRGGTIGKIRSIRFDGTNDITRSPPKLHPVSQIISGESRMRLPFLANATNANPISNKLQGAKRWRR